MDKLENEYHTPDMCLAACLMTDGVRYLRSEKDEQDTRYSKRLIFVFDLEGGKKLEEVERIKRERANATHVASTVHYDECLRRLKSVIHST